MDYRAITHINLAEIPDADELPEDCADDDTFIKSTKVEFNSIRGKTLGPIVPPVNQAVICDTFILNLIGQVREAAALGWIKHDMRERGAQEPAALDTSLPPLLGEAKTIAEKLNLVRIHCQKGRFSAAREILRGLPKDIAALRGKHINEEAYLLLKFNVEFLLEKL